MRRDALDSNSLVTENSLTSVREFLSKHANTPPSSFLSRLLGRRPIPAELCAVYRLACAEVAVIDTLLQLGSAWTVLHSVPIGRGNDDLEYVVAGPAGVYSIALRQHQGGAIWIDGGVLLADGERMSHIRDAEFEAVRASQLLSELVGSRIEVTPCLVIAGSRSLTVSKPPRRVAILATHNLRSWFKDLPVVLDAVALEKFRLAISELSHLQDLRNPAPEVASSLVRFRRVQAALNQARHTKLTWATGAVVLAWLLAMVYLGESAVEIFR